MDLRRKYRPETFDQFLGNQNTVAALRSFLEKPDTIPQLFLFHGDVGCGKTTMARIVAGALKVKFVKEMNVAAAGAKKVQNIIIGTCQHIHVLKSFWLIEEFHALTEKEQTALLKSLEEPPTNVYFALCTNNFHEVIAPIRSRAQCFELGPLSDKDILKLIIDVAVKERIKLSRELRQRIIDQAQGVPRDALKLLERCPHLPPAEEPVDEQKKGKVIKLSL